MPFSEGEIRERVARVPQWHHILRFDHGVTTPGAYDPGDLLARLKLPDLRGKRVLDVGARDGFFAFECERRGAQVLAVDHSDPDLTGFRVAREIYGLTAEYRQANVYDLDARELGQFDVVLFLGVLYHLRHPLLALDRLRELCGQLLVVESLVCDAAFHVGYEQARPLAELAPGAHELPLAQFLPVGRFHADATNKWVPNLAGLRALVEDAAFAVRSAETWGDRALLQATPDEQSPALRWLALDRGLRTRTS